MKAQRNSQHFQSGNHIRYGISIAELAVFWSAPAFAQGETAAEVVADQTGPGAADDQPPAATPQPIQSGDRVVVTARRVEEDVQDVPIPVAVLSEDFLADTGAFNAGRISSLVPSVQFYSTNPRNSAINIRGIGSPFGLTNDGIEQGVGLYVDGVYYARPAADTALAQLCDAAGRSRWRHLVGSRGQGGLPRDLALCGCAVGR
jgi:iron complex outermembrane receptor protein